MAASESNLTRYRALAAIVLLVTVSGCCSAGSRMCRPPQWEARELNSRIPAHGVGAALELVFNVEARS